MMEDKTIAERKERISSMTYTELVVRKDYLMYLVPNPHSYRLYFAVVLSTAVLKCR